MERPTIIVKGTEYAVRPYQPNPRRPQWLGFGGRHFVIEILETGERIHTNDLIYRLETTDADTAKFIHVSHSGSICQCPGFAEVAA